MHPARHTCPQRASRIAWLLAAILALTPLTLPARVFSRWGSAGRIEARIEAMGGTQNYTARIRLNGGEGTLHCFAFDATPASIARQLTATLNAEGLTPGDGSLFIGTAESQGQHLRLILLRPDPGAPTTLFLIQQDQAAFKRSQTLPLSLPDPLLTYPGARPTFTATDDSAGTTVGMAVTAAEPAAIQTYFAHELTARGWHPPLPGAQADTTTGDALRLYIMPDAIFCVGTTRDAADGNTRITLLHKKLGLK